MQSKQEDTNPIETLTKEFMAQTEKMLKGYKILSEVEEIDVATAEKTIVWQEDKVRLFRYESDVKKKVKTPVLISYALVNRFDMMDLQPDRSFIRKLLEEGVDVYLIDWGYPTRTDRYLTMDDYINGYIDSCVDFVSKETGHKKINLMGICQGGTFSAIYTSLHKEKIKNLITLVAPFDFNTEDGLLFKWSRDIDVDKIVDANDGLVPGEFLNMGFDMLKPISKVKKFVNILDVMEDKDKLMNFLRMEQWVADSPDQAGECYRQFIKDLYQQNKLIKGELNIGGHTVNLKNIDVPVLTIFATHDHLVPPSATQPFHDYISSKDKTLYEFPGGHIGVFVGSRSQRELGPKVAQWLADHE
ncbi:MAG: class III poly(R)-hydroxyalkanoic acid synthase subunit PhaC [Bernardetiaceae bacterium]|nr:class III poly(R)-hydroxyalkanoic acid synthase subunit PhaC [Bernardetiaceae bacterium]